ncbi:MAG: antitoxin Xre/MbcA/ParS toxin-binding domain-containing protein [Pirellula sp.]|jgi:putative toxin-antitoxin system antitoxin component (TIGR02293 family)
MNKTNKKQKLKVIEPSPPPKAIREVASVEPAKVAIEEITKGMVPAKAARMVRAKVFRGGIVYISIHGKSSNGAAVELTPSKLVMALKAGLPIQELDDLRSDLDLPMEKLVPMLGISRATLNRRRATGKLGIAESDRVVRYARLLGKAASVMESVENGRRWLASPQVGLGGAIPLEFAETEVGAREVENLLGRIEYGVYS